MVITMEMHEFSEDLVVTDMILQVDYDWDKGNPAREDEPASEAGPIINEIKVLSALICTEDGKKVWADATSLLLIQKLIDGNDFFSEWSDEKIRESIQ